jgi:hypothetical protein
MAQSITPYAWHPHLAFYQAVRIENRLTVFNKIDY